MSKYAGVVQGYDDDDIKEYKGTPLLAPFYVDTVKKCEALKYDPSDVVLVAYPKTGNTWLSEIIWLICNNADVEASAKKHVMERFPMMEMKAGSAPSCVEALIGAPSPRYINTHLPYHILAKSLEETKPKVIVIMRNPKDVLVSFYHFVNTLPGRKVEKFTDFFKLFLDNRLEFGNYIDHTAEWYQQRDKPYIYFITYEEVKADHYGCVEKLAKFLEKDLSPEQLQIITDATCMSSMKKRGVSKGGATFKDEGAAEKKKEKEGKVQDNAFFRKGIVGDWKNNFTEEQSQLIERLCREKLEPLGLKFQFE